MNIRIEMVVFFSSDVSKNVMEKQVSVCRKKIGIICILLKGFLGEFENMKVVMSVISMFSMVIKVESRKILMKWEVIICCFDNLFIMFCCCVLNCILLVVIKMMMMFSSILNIFVYYSLKFYIFGKEQRMLLFFSSIFSFGCFCMKKWQIYI